jgi:hypothetical protein
MSFVTLSETKAGDFTVLLRQATDKAEQDASYKFDVFVQEAASTFRIDVFASFEAAQQHRDKLVVEYTSRSQTC